LKTLIDWHPEFIVVGEAGSAGEALEKMTALGPEIVIMDIRLPGASGIEACQEITQKFPGTKVLMLTSYAADELLISAIRAGASGYVLKQIGSDDLIRALEAVARGEAPLDPAVTQHVIHQVRRLVKAKDESAFVRLNDQERQVLLLVVGGRTNKQIGKTLFLGEGTVRNYASSIYLKLGVSNRAEAAAFAVQHNLSKYVSV
jgi:DNA-binding NarL/FixJ family response regulator